MTLRESEMNAGTLNPHDNRLPPARHLGTAATCTSHSLPARCTDPRSLLDTGRRSRAKPLSEREIEREGERNREGERERDLVGS